MSDRYTVISTTPGVSLGAVTATGASAAAALAAIGAVPTSRTVAGDALSGDITAATLRAALSVGGGSMTAAMWDDATTDYRMYGVVRGTATIINSRASGTYDITVPSGGTYPAQDRVSHTDPLARFDGGWQVTDTGTAIGVGSTLPISGAKTAGNRVEPAGAFSVVAWVCPLWNHTTGFSRFMLQKRLDDSNWNTGVSMTLELGAPGDARPSCSVLDDATLRTVTGTRALTVGRLVQIAMTLSAATGTLTLYVNGVSQGTVSVTTGVTWGSATNRALEIGAVSGGTGAVWAQEFPGWIGRVGQWPRALSAAELLTDVLAVLG